MEVVREVEVRDEVRDTVCTCGDGGGGGCEGGWERQRWPGRFRCGRV